MSEFNDRMSVQREIVACVNAQGLFSEELCGLSEGAISRWAQANTMSAEDELLRLLRKIADKLSFLACKSQEAVSEEYKHLSAEIGQLTQELKKVLK